MLWYNYGLINYVWTNIESSPGGTRERSTGIGALIRQRNDDATICYGVQRANAI